MALAIVQPKGSTDGPAGRQALIDRAINLEMRTALRRISQRLVKFPRRNGATSALAGPPFELPSEVVPAHHGLLFLDEFPEFRRQVLEVLRQLLQKAS
jgi:predicted ATPase with chaperone activity